MEQTPRLLDQVRHAARLRHYSFSTERSYVQWIKRFILANGKCHPRDLGAKDVEAVLTGLAVASKVSPSTQNQALSAILFLYRHVLKVDLDWMDNIVRAKRERKIHRQARIPARSNAIIPIKRLFSVPSKQR